MLICSIAKEHGRQNVWDWFCFYYILEGAASCISVTLLKRHLMVLAIFAPRFVFATVFSTICLIHSLFLTLMRLVEVRVSRNT